MVVRDTEVAGGGRVYYGWWVVATVFVLLFMAYGTRNSFGVFLKPMSADLGWSIGMLSTAFSLHMALYSASAFVLGKLTDKYGPRVIMAAGAAVMGIGALATSRLDSFWQFYITYGLITGVGMGGLYVPGAGTVSKFFVSKRALALGITVAGCGAGAFVFLPLTQYLITLWDWRSGFVFLGIMLALSAFLPVVILRGRGLPEDMGLVPDGAVAKPGEGRIDDLGSSLTLRQALRTGAFWTWIGMYAMVALAIDGILMHLPAYFTDIGFDPATAAWLTSLRPLSYVAGSIILGGFADRLNRRMVLAVALGFGAPLVVGLMQLGPSTMPAVIVAVLLFGLVCGTVYPMTIAVAADVFGRRAMGSLMGVGTIAVGVGGAAGPSLAGLLRDATGSYHPALWMMAGGLALAAVCTLLIKPVRRTSSV